MARRAVLTGNDERDIAERYKNGAGIVDLARAYRCRTAVINEIIKASGTPRVMLTANTPIECRLHDALKAAGIGFTTQKRLVGRYVVDVSVHQMPVVIEADGAMHHSGAKAQSRDAVRDAAHEAAGYRVFRFTGSQINTDAAECVRKVVDACGLVPDEEPVYNIRATSKEPGPRKIKVLELICGYCGEQFTSRWSRKFCTPEHVSLHLSEVGKKGKGRLKSAEHRAKIGEANRRRVVTAETRAKMSASAMGKPGTLTGRSPSAETRAKISVALTGYRQSDETRAKKSGAHQGKAMNEATRAKISAALKGKSKSPEHRANLSASRIRANQIMIESDPA
jgi:very-short-patch-repair endonuclease